MTEIKNGMTAKDKVTGFEGVVLGLIDYATGCNQVLLVPTVDKEGKRRDGEWFDVQRVEQVGTEIILFDNENNPGCDISGPLK